MCNGIYEKIMKVHTDAQESSFYVEIEADNYGDVALSGFYNITHTPDSGPSAKMIGTESLNITPATYSILLDKDIESQSIAAGSLVVGYVKVLFMRPSTFKSTSFDWANNTPEGL